jgi:hypothetical protein
MLGNEIKNIELFCELIGDLYVAQAYESPHDYDLLVQEQIRSVEVQKTRQMEKVNQYSPYAAKKETIYKETKPNTAQIE